jgi:hypothetical protein
VRVERDGSVWRKSRGIHRKPRGFSLRSSSNTNNNAWMPTIYAAPSATRLLRAGFTSYWHSIVPDTAYIPNIPFIARQLAQDR